MVMPHQLHNQESTRLAIHRCTQSLEHASQCRDVKCCLPSCEKMKRIILHVKSCARRVTHSCAICKQLIALNFYHAKSCQEANCPVPFCLNVKYKFRQQKLNLAQILRRRIATTQNKGMTETVKQSSKRSSSSALSNQSSPDPKLQSSPQLPQPGIDMNPAASLTVAANHLQGI